MRIKLFLFISLIVLVGCSTPPQKVVREYPIKLGETYDIGYTFEVWENPDGTRYLQRGNVKLEIYQGGRNKP